MKKKKVETSKLLLWLLLSACGVVVALSLVLIFIYQDLAPLITLITCIFSTTDIAVGFYFWKAKNENLHKYKQDDKIGDI